MEKNIIVFTAKSAAGKTTITNELLKIMPNTGIIRSTITRHPRPDDSNDEYEYVTFEEFCRLRKNGEFVSWRKMSKDPDRTDDLYSVRVSEISKAIKSNKIFIRSLTPDTILRWFGVAGNKITFIHLLAPNEKEARRRMEQRGGMSPAQIDERIREEKDWDEDVNMLIQGGIPIHIVPQLPLDDVLREILEIIWK
ncbi:MAG: hypothetical protein ACD_5C00343G0005 [uncultured bacterium]|nr:MAG: hypothetical protein ACD_5C00343G0005 [uncultured bacterium]